MSKLTIIALVLGAGIVCLALALPKDSAWRPQSTQVAAGPSFAKPQGYVDDETGSLTADQVAALDAKLKGFSDAGHQVAVLVIGSTKGMPIEDYGIRLAEAWQVGDATRDDGVILIVAKDDRKLRIEVGSGAEALITDAEAQAIIDRDVAPKLKAGDWSGGISDGLEAIYKQLTN